MEMKAELKVARAAEHAERRAAADEAERLRRHRELMDFYDTMTPEELQQYMQMQGRIRNEERNKDSPLRQPLAPGPPCTYDLRGDPSSVFVGPCVGPSLTAPRRPATAVTAATTAPAAAIVATHTTDRTAALPGVRHDPAARRIHVPEWGRVHASRKHQAFDDTISEADAPISPVHPQQPLGEPGPSEA